jgi:hypothetical protein
MAAAKTRKRNPPNRATVILRMPHDMKAWIDDRAREEDRTITAKVIRCIAAEMKREKAEREMVSA